MIKLKGEIIKVGYGQAKGCITKQTDLLKPYVPEISSYFPGSINVKLTNPISIAVYDVETPPIEWRENCCEKFRFVRAGIELCIEGSEEVPCLLYFAEYSPYKCDLCIVEVLTRWLNINGVKDCFIILSQPCHIILGNILRRFA